MLAAMGKPPGEMVSMTFSRSPQLSTFISQPFRFQVSAFQVWSAYAGSVPGLEEGLGSFPGFTVGFVHKPFHAATLKAALLKCLQSAA